MASFRYRTTVVPKPIQIVKNSPDPDGLLEYSVVYTDRALNHMSKKFQHVMKDLNALLCGVYNADKAVILPGSGSAAMAAVARQFANREKVVVVRNGYFSFRWSQIFSAGNFNKGEPIIHMARAVENGSSPSYAPPPLEEVVRSIHSERPGVVFAAHVETSAGVILSDDYIRAVSKACEETDALFVLDCIASGCLWIDMKTLGVDVLITAPQKGWSGPAGVGVAMLGAKALKRLKKTESSCFVLNLKMWAGIMDAYHNPSPGHAYHCTLPTDAIVKFLETAQECQDLGFENLRTAQWEQGQKVRDILQSKGVKSVAAEGFKSPTVIVSYASEKDLKSGAKFASEGIQIAAGVPLMVDDFSSGPDFDTWRIGLFGLDKLTNIERTVCFLENTFEKIGL